MRSSRSLEEAKVHTTACTRRLNQYLLRWRYQSLPRKLWQGFLALYLTLILTSTDRLHSILTTSSHKAYPRCIQVSINDVFPIEPISGNTELDGNVYVHHEVEKLSRKKTKNDVRDDHSRDIESFEEGDCKAMHSFQIGYYPSCNSIHELYVEKNRLINNGGFRDVWYARMYDGSPFVMKTLVYKKKSTLREIDRHRRDANTYSMLKASIHVPDIYGFCGNTALFDLAPNGTLEDMAEDEDKLEMSTWTPAHRLRYAWQVIKAVADLHEIGNIHNSAAIAHTDISTDQFLWVDGMFQLNDFNRARFIRWNSVKQEPCKFSISKNPGKNRSPEEYIKDTPLDEKIDVYSTGNVLYTIMTGDKVFKDISKQEVYKMVPDGYTPRVPPEKLSKFNSMEMAVVQAMNMCHIYNPDVRSTAKDVEAFLRGKLQEYDVSYF